MNRLTTFSAGFHAPRFDYRPYLGVCGGSDDVLILIGFNVSIEAEQRNARVYNRVESPKLRW